MAAARDESSLYHAPFGALIVCHHEEFICELWILQHTEHLIFFHYTKDYKYNNTLDTVSL